MVEQIFNQLKTPKTLEVLHQRLQQIGLNWNKAQVELFVQLDRNIIKQGDVYFVESGSSNDKILEIIDKAMEGRPVIPVKKIMEMIPQEIITSDSEIIKIAQKSSRYKSPNNVVIVKI